MVFWREMAWGNWGKLPPYFWGLMIPLALWEVVWKGIALWKSARSKQKGWFIAILIINSLGVLSIIYLAFFQKGKK